MNLSEKIRNENDEDVGGVLVRTIVLREWADEAAVLEARVAVLEALLRDIVGKVK